MLKSFRIKNEDYPANKFNLCPHEPHLYALS